MSLAEFNVLTMLCDFLTTEYLMRKDGRPSAETLKVDDYLDNKVLVDERQYSATVVALQTIACFKLDEETLQSAIGVKNMKGRKGSHVVA